VATASVISLPLAAPSLATTHLHLASLGSVLALGVFGSGFAYLLYYYMLNTLGATRATTVTFLLPVTALVWGVSILHESVTLPMLAGMLIIFSGVFLTSRRSATNAPVRARTEDKGVA
jgi:drug/metabolite transporter (DMT)-like permease